MAKAYRAAIRLFETPDKKFPVGATSLKSVVVGSWFGTWKSRRHQLPVVSKSLTAESSELTPAYSVGPAWLKRGVRDSAG
jgi:hypothetical protein